MPVHVDGWSLIHSFIGTEVVSGWTGVTNGLVRDAGGTFWAPPAAAHSLTRLDVNLAPYSELLATWEQSSHPTDGLGASRGGVVLMTTATDYGYQPAGGRTHGGSSWTSGGAPTAFYDRAPASGVDAIANWTAMKALINPNNIQIFCKDEWINGAYSGADSRQSWNRLALYTQDGRAYFRNFKLYKRFTALPV